MADTAAEVLSRRLSEYPANALPFFQNAFAIAARLSENSRTQLIEEFLAGLEKGSRNVGGIEPKAIEGLTSRDTQQLNSVFSLLSGLFSESKATPDDFINSARDLLFLAKDEFTARAIAVAICTRGSEVGAAIERAQLAGAVLPSLSSFNVALDLRLRIVDTKIKTGVSVAIVHIDTDSSKEFWIQLSKSDVETIIDKLKSTFDDMKIAESLLVGRS